MIDFTMYKFSINQFGGTALKGTIITPEMTYLIKKKDPIRNKEHFDTLYSSSIYSEDIGCKIYRLLGLEVQNTFLCKCKDKDKVISCCACEVFSSEKKNLIEFRKCLISNISSSSSNGKVTPIESILEVLRENYPYNLHPEFEERFWDMMVVDALIHNSDRHLDNWGFLNNKDDESKISLAPVYDCGSSFSAHLSETGCLKCLNSPSLLSMKELNVALPFSYNGKRVFITEIFKDPPGGLKNSILKLVPRIESSKNEIDKLVKEEEEVSKIRKDFIIASMNLRFNRVLKPALKRCENMNCEREFTRRTNHESDEASHKMDNKKMDSLSNESCSSFHL